MCGTINMIEDQFDVAKSLSSIAEQLDEYRLFLHDDEATVALITVEALHRRARDFAGGRVAEIYGDEEEDTHL